MINFSLSFVLVSLVTVWQNEESDTFARIRQPPWDTYTAPADRQRAELLGGAKAHSSSLTEKPDLRTWSQFQCRSQL